MLAQQYKTEVRPASILPSLDVSSVAWFLNPDGSTRTGQIEELSQVDDMWWAACRYELLPGVWILENRLAFNFWSGVGPEFPFQLKQEVFFNRGDGWQTATITDFYLESGEWFVVVEYALWYGIVPDEKPLCEIRATQPEPDEKSVSKADFWADYEYENRRDSR